MCSGHLEGGAGTGAIRHVELLMICELSGDVLTCYYMIPWLLPPPSQPQTRVLLILENPPGNNCSLLYFDAIRTTKRFLPFNHNVCLLSVRSFRGLFQTEKH